FQSCFPHLFFLRSRSSSAAVTIMIATEAARHRESSFFDIRLSHSFALRAPFFPTRFIPPPLLFLCLFFLSASFYSAAFSHVSGSGVFLTPGHPRTAPCWPLPDPAVPARSANRSGRR